MKVLVLSCAERMPDFAHDVLTTLEVLRQHGAPLECARIDCSAPYARVAAASVAADAVLAMPGAMHRPRVAALAHAADLFAEVHTVASGGSGSARRPAWARAVDLVVVGDRLRGQAAAQTCGVVAGARELVGSSTLRYREGEIRDLARVAFDIALGRGRRLVSVDQADRLDVMALWRDVVSELAREYRDIRVEHLLIEQAVRRLVVAPDSFDTLVAGADLAGIVAAQAGALAGLPHVWPHALVGAGTFGIYEASAGGVGSGPADATRATLNALMLACRRAPPGDPLRAAVERASAQARRERPLQRN